MKVEIVKKDSKNSAEKIKSSEGTVEVFKEMEKIIRSNKRCILLLAYQEGKIFETFKTNDKYTNLVDNFGISKSPMVFQKFLW